MATTKNITMKQFNGTDYDTLYPKTIVEQVDGVYNKQEILEDTTKSMFGYGSSAIPDTIFQWLGKYNQYWWKRRNINYAENQETVKESVKVTNGDTAREVYYGDTITFKESGEISIDDPVSVRITWSGCATQSSVIQGKYVTGLYEGESLIFFVPDGVLMQYSGSRVQYAENSIMAVTAVAGLGQWSYIQSSDRNAYPDSGIVDNYEYQYLGIPFDNAVESPVIEIIEYTGTGTYGPGVGAKNELTFSRKPKLVIIAPKNASGGLNANFAVYTRGSRGMAGSPGNTNVVNMD